MEDIQLNNFIVKSNIHDYEVCFISNVEECFIQELISGDFIIIDNKLISLFPKLFKKLLSDYDYIAINLLFFLNPFLINWLIIGSTF